MAEKISPIKAIRLHCLDCCCNNANEVKECPTEKCALHPFRFGKNPYSTRGKNMTEEQKKAMVDRLAKAREAKNS